VILRISWCWWFAVCVALVAVDLLGLARCLTHPEPLRAELAFAGSALTGLLGAAMAWLRRGSR